MRRVESVSDADSLILGKPMKAVLFKARRGEVIVEDIPAPQLAPGCVLIRNEFSLISAGTERAKLATGRQSLIGKARSRPDQVKQVLQSARQIGVRETYQIVNDRLDAPGLMGYSCAGRVLAVGEGADDIRPGSPVAAAGAGYANHSEIVSVPRNLCVPLPEGVSTRSGAFTTVGAIALQGIRQAEAQPGSRIAVIGLGLVGQLTLRLLNVYSYEAVGIDRDDDMVQLARAAGLTALERGDGSLAESLSRVWGSDGADAVIITAATKSSDPMESAGEIARDRATIVVVGDVQVAPPRSTYYGKELSIRYSRSYGPGRYDPIFEEGGIEYPQGYVPWSEQRNLAEIVRLMQAGLLEVDSLSPVEFPVDQAAAAYRLLSGDGGERRVAILIAYGPAVTPSDDGAAPMVEAPAPPPAPRSRPVAGEVGIAAVGAGSFPTRMLFPHLKKRPDVRFAWVTTSTGVTAYHQGKRWSFGRVVGSIEEGLALGSADCVMVLSRHDSHAKLATSVLQAGVALFVEKPLGLTEEELDEVANAWMAGGAPAMVGFNRRFSPAVRQLKASLGSRGPIQVAYRVFAGNLPSGHWYFDPAQGGRLLGEVCHFVDTAGYIVGSPPVTVTALPGDRHRDPVRSQSVTACIEYADGSTATIVYGGHTPPGAPKEVVEVAADGLAARIEDYRSIRLWTGKEEKRRFKGAAKGHAEEMAALIDLLRGREASACDFGLSLWSSLATCRVAESLMAGQPVAVTTELPSLTKALEMDGSSRTRLDLS
jgi:predicted dehydrogenase/threonine dehydrogenase-like Zn-dependent dehydrogenase